MTEPCEKCGKAVQIGEWPFCPHGFSVHGVIDDQLEGGPRFFETLGHEPVWIESKSQLRREAEARGKIPFVRHDDAYYKRVFRRHDEERRDTGTNR